VSGTISLGPIPAAQGGGQDAHVTGPAWLVAIVRKRLELEASLYQILQILRKRPFHASFRPSTQATISLKTTTNRFSSTSNRTAVL